MRMRHWRSVYANQANAFSPATNTRAHMVPTPARLCMLRPHQSKDTSQDRLTIHLGQTLAHLPNEARAHSYGQEGATFKSLLCGLERPCEAYFRASSPNHPDRTVCMHPCAPTNIPAESLLPWRDAPSWA